ncbi:MAG: 50S ribosomal protein L25/general stress protein Ctc [Desulfuromonadales bacterium]|nr:50S ribosomal protein L25/general stress protein Ctc [Desulfuromonadales bacterium]
MAKSILNVEPRVRIGKGGARKVRNDGLVPAVVYGKGMDTLNLRVEPKSLEKAIATEAGWNTLITLKGDGPFDGKVVILKDMHIHPIRREMMHVDFHAIDLRSNVSVMVPVHTVGKAEGEKMGGSLQVIRHELEVVCLPSHIPAVIEIDVTSLQVGDVVHVEDLTLPEGVEVPHEVNFTVLTLTGRKAGEESETGEEGEAEAETEAAE